MLPPIEGETERILNEETGYYETKDGDLFISFATLGRIQQLIDTCSRSEVAVEVKFKQEGLIVEIDPIKRRLVVSHPCEKYQKELNELFARIGD